MTSEEPWVDVRISRKLADNLTQLKGVYSLDDYCERILKAFVKKERKEIMRLIREIRGDTKTRRKQK